MDKLIEGYRRFRAGAWPEHRDRFETLAAEGQRPHAMVVACSDSRVDPQMIFNAAPGELFVIRNVANLVPPYAPDHRAHGTSAALEFGVRALEVPRIVVMGHGLCGGCGALLEPPAAPVGDFVLPWVEMADSARQKALASGLEGEDLRRACEHEVVRLSLANLMSFPWVRQAVEDRRLILEGCWFNVMRGELTRLGPEGFETVQPWVDS